MGFPRISQIPWIDFEAVNCSFLLEEKLSFFLLQPFIVISFEIIVMVLDVP